MMSPPVRRRAAQGAAHVEPQAPRVRLIAAGAQFGLRQFHLRDRAGHLRDFGRAHLREILLLQDFLVGDREPEFLLLGLRRFAHLRLRQRLLDPARGRRRLLPGVIRQRHRIQHVLPFLGGAEEQVERLREDQRMLVALDEDGLQRGVDVGAVADLDHLQRVHRIDHRARPDRNPGRAQRAGKADDVVGDQAGRRDAVVERGHLRLSDCVFARPGMTANQFSLVASFKTFCSASPCIRAMSSWYFSSAPSVSPTTCGVSERASSSVSAVAQSMVSATPGDL